MTSIGASHGPRARWVMRATAAFVVAGSLAVVAAEVSAAQAAPAATKLQVVKVVTRHPFGKMLATVKGASLYTIASNKCTGSCLPAWPPLLMPKGSKATPTGISCLSTVKFGRRLQVEYRGLKLWTFVGDKGTSVTGNGVAGFKVAKVHTGACPLTVVQVVSRHPVGKMLASAKSGLSLYYQPTGTCDASCQSSWPPLTMPKGSKDVPAGTTCLGTKLLGTLNQVTYRGHRLYTFTGDSGSSVNGIGLLGFVAAKVTTGKC